LSDDLREFLAKARAQRSTTASSAARVLSLDELHLRGGQERAAEPWGLAALRGRLVELSGRGAVATLTTAIDLVLEAQREAEPVAWIVPWTTDARGPSGTFYPPDVADSGVDLSALVVVRAPTVVAAARSAERLLRSGAFGLVVLDLCSAGAELGRMPEHFLGRLVTLAQAHDAAIVCLTEKSHDATSVGSLVSLRAEALRTRTGTTGFEVTVRALKDKRRGPGWSRALKARGPAGL